MNLEDFVGQDNTKRIVKKLIETCKAKKQMLPHTLLVGKSGFGKTTLVNIISRMCDQKLIRISGNTNNILGALIDLEGGEILFIDEIHLLKPQLQEELYYPLSDEPSIQVANQTLRLEKFTLIAATTKPGHLQRPLLNRFKIRLEMIDYTEDEIKQIITNYCKREKIKIDAEAIDEIANRSRCIPRESINHIELLRNYCPDKITKEQTLEYFNRIGIDEIGLGRSQKNYLNILASSTKPLGSKTLQTILELDKQSLEEIESFLLKKGLINISTKGRELTINGLIHIKKKNIHKILVKQDGVL